MSAKAETLAAPARPIASFVLAIVVTLAVGATAGSLITQAVTPEVASADVETVGITPWDQQKLDAMESRQLAETVGDRPGPGSHPGIQDKLDAAGSLQASAQHLSS